MGAYLSDNLAWGLAILKVVVGLGFVIFVHELGHFLVAKLCGVKCEKFYIGFDVPIRLGPIRFPASLCKFQWGETEYGIGTIPLGGYVKMLGQDDNPANAQAEAERIRVNKGSGDGADDEFQEVTLDPRSFPAKSVPKRMAIISAGVLMNLLFALIFAVVAYRMGVEYIPAEIGGTAPGSDAWVNNLKPGWQIVQIGQQEEPSDNVRWIDLKREVVFNGGRSELPMVVREGDSEVRMKLTPRKLSEDAEDPAIGVRLPATNELAEETPVFDYMSAGEPTNGFEGGDTIVQIEAQDEKQPITSGHQIQAMLARHFGETLRFRVERRREGAEESEAPRTLDIAVPPNPLRVLGLSMRMGPITAIQTDSPALEAGLRKGDVVLSLAGEEVVEPMMLSQMARRHVGQSVPVEVRRDGEKIDLEIVPVAPLGYNDHVGPDSPTSADELGIAFDVTNTVARVREGSPADRQGIKPGDVLVAAAFEKGDEDFQKEMAKVAAPEYHEPIPLGENSRSWPHVFSLLQSYPTDAVLNLTYSSGGREKTVKLTSEASDTWFNENRGLRLTLKTRIHQAKSWDEAVALGYRETKERFTEVFRVLRQVFTGEIGMNKLSGPVGIIRAASYEARTGTSRLLMFLTFLSVNLAIINFLPIPILDGGHMVFLTYELVVGKPINENIQMKLSLASLLFLLALIAVVTIFDIQR